MKAHATFAADFDPKAAKLTHDWQHNARLLCCRVDPTGRFVVAGGIDYCIQRWEIANGTKVTLTGHDNWIRTLSFSPDGAVLYSGGYDGRLIAWDIGSEMPQPVRSIHAHQGWLRGLAVSPDGQRVATCGNDRLLKVWNTADGQLVRKFDASEIHNLIGDLAPFGGIINLAFSPDGKRLTASGLHKTSNAPAGNRHAVALSFLWASGEKLPKQESIKKELDATICPQTNAILRSIRPQNPRVRSTEKQSLTAPLLKG